jgi:hypothetical protein
LSSVLERIEPLAAIIIIVFHLLILYLSALSNTPENPFATIYSESLIKTTCQHLLLLVGFDTLIYRKYYDTPRILVCHHQPCKFHSVSGKPVGHTTRQCNFTRDLERGNHQLPGPPPILPTEGQGNQSHDRQPTKAAGDYPKEANVEHYHVFTTQKEDANDELWFGVEVNVVMPAEP